MPVYDQFHSHFITSFVGKQLVRWKFSLEIVRLYRCSEAVNHFQYSSPYFCFKFIRQIGLDMWNEIAIVWSKVSHLSQALKIKIYNCRYDLYISCKTVKRMGRITQTVVPLLIQMPVISSLSSSIFKFYRFLIIPFLTCFIFWQFRFLKLPDFVRILYSTHVLRVSFSMCFIFHLFHFPHNSYYYYSVSKTFISFSYLISFIPSFLLRSYRFIFHLSRFPFLDFKSL